MTGAPAPSGRAFPERELLETVAGELRRRGYRTYLDPDGTDYFDLAARRGDEVGLIEGKAGSGAEVLGQALRRRPWADWVAVAVASARVADRLVARTSGRRASLVGVWWSAQGVAREVRPATPSPVPDESPFSELRLRLRQRLVALDDGALPAGVRWSGVVAEVRRASRGRGFSEWRLDEPDPGPA